MVLVPVGTTLDLPCGEVGIIARAGDTAGTVQPGSEAPWNPKGYFNTAWARIRRTAS